MRRGLALLCALALSLTVLTPLPAGAVGGSEEPEETVVRGLAPWNDWMATPTLYIFEDGKFPVLPSVAICLVSPGGTAEVPVEWDTATLDGTPGWRQVAGRLLLPEGMALSETFEPFSLTVLSLSPEMEPLPLNGFGDLTDVDGVIRDPAQTLRFALPCGIERQEAREALWANVLCETQAGAFSYPVEWDLSPLGDCDEPGVYELRGMPVLPSYFAPPAGFTGFMATVYLQRAGELPDLSTGGPTDYGWECVWAEPLPDPAGLVLEYAVGQEEEAVWTADPFVASAGFPLRTANLGITVNETALFVPRILPSPGTVYRVRLRLGERTSGVLTARAGETVITEVIPPDQKQLRFFVMGEPLDEARLSLPEEVDCLTDQSGQPLVRLPVEWSLDSVDTAVNQPQELVGTVQLAEGWRFGEGVPTQVSCTLLPTWEGMPARRLDALHPVENIRLQILPVGGDPDTLLGGLWIGQTGDNYFYCDPNWDLSGFDPDRVGRYQLTACPQLPYAYLRPEEALPTLALQVMPDDDIDLSAYETQLFSVRCKWLYEADSQKMRLERAVGRGPWEAVEAEPLEDGLYSFGASTYGPTWLELDLLDHQEGVDYYYRFVYGGRGSNVLHIRNELDAAYVESLLDWGDRGGADGGEQTMPDLEQEAPAPPPVDVPITVPPGEIETEDPPGFEEQPQDEPPAQEPPEIPEVSDPPAPAMERVTQSGSTVSAARLEQMAGETREPLLFEKHGISVEFPASLLDELALSDRELLTVEIAPWGENGFTLAVSAGGRAVSALPETTARFPYTGESAALSPLALFDEQGREVSEAAYDDALSVVTVTITATGSYRAAPRAEADTDALPPVPEAAPDSAPAEEKDDLSAMILPLAIGAAALLLVVLAQRKGGERHD